ncbi:MAG: hypothetical protein HYU44_07580 [Betaproteobacteria bacterium]|nr:hypothetical protein [Betaproteobacteria bacterium]MBI3052701.1 hypothetical protein [Betaproteobacteria bacterium]
MADTQIPDDIRDFIITRVDSIAHIEALMLLRHDPEISWDAASLAARLYISVDEAKRVLEELGARSLLMVDNGVYRYGCASPELKVLVDRLARIYATQLIAVTNLVHAKASSRIKQFADAFRLRKDK